MDVDEEKPLDLKREMADGQERDVWNADLSLPAKEFELSALELARLRTALQSWAGGLAVAGICLCPNSRSRPNAPRPGVVT